MPSSNPDLQLLAVLACRVNRTRQAREVAEFLETTFPNEALRTRIHENARLGEAFNFRRTVLQYAPESSGAVEYRAAASELLARVRAPRQSPGPGRGSWNCRRSLMAQSRGSSLGDVRRLFQSAPEAAISPPDEEPASDNGSHRRSTPTAQTRKKVRATFHVYEDTLDQAKNAVVTLMGPPLFLTLSDLLDEALREKVVELQNAHNNGQPFPSRGGNLQQRPATRKLNGHKRVPYGTKTGPM